MNHKFLQTLALVAWVQSQVHFSDEFLAEQYARLSVLSALDNFQLETPEEHRTNWHRNEFVMRLEDIYDAAAVGNHREYLRLVAGCPHEFKNRVFLDNAPVGWTPVQNRPRSHWRWHEMGE